MSATLQTRPRVGLVGIGSMGLVVAKALVESGYLVVGYRRGDSSTFLALGGTIAGGVNEVFEKTDIVLLLLPTGFDLSSLEHGEGNGPLRFRKGQAIVSLGTYPVEVKRWARDAASAREALFLDCEISGTPSMVESRKGAVFVSGESEAPDAVKRILETFSNHVYFVGAFGNASIVKLLANHLVAVNNLAVAEVILVGQRAGLEPAAIVSALQTSAGASAMLSVRGPLMVARDFEPTMGGIRGFLKSLSLVAGLARSTGTVTPLLDEAERCYDEALATGQGQYDIAAIIESLEYRTKQLVP
jgi:3-hydroxyisobutyrate dehydrogenase-like beta-hydroxyacid dehydrogenase